MMPAQMQLEYILAEEHPAHDRLGCSDICSVSPSLDGITFGGRKILPALSDDGIVPFV